MFAISPTDKNWFDFLKSAELNSYVNFWTPTPWNIKKLKKGNRLYFMLKSPIRKIGGFGEFVEYKNMMTADAWKEFGYRNGRTSRIEFIDSIQNYIDKNSDKFGGKAINAATYEIGCIVLNNCEFWDEPQFLKPENFNVDFATQVVTIKYFDEFDPFTKVIDEDDDFKIVSETRNDKLGLIKIRDGQSKFKGKILRAYNNKCCVTGETIPELLEAAHIQEYRNKESNHVQNGLLLRVDIHRLYDNRLIFIDKNYVVHISNLITSTEYRQYNGRVINLPSALSDYPSKGALEMRKDEFRN